jgi:hypothetical protein
MLGLYLQHQKTKDKKNTMRNIRVMTRNLHDQKTIS